MSNLIYDFTVTTLDNHQLDLASLRGKVLLIVNTASKCGFNKQYRELEQLYQQYQTAGLMILAFPCNQFANQEPGDAQQISQFCELNYGISFPLMAKINVNGPNTEPLYQFLKQQAPGLWGTRNIKWNFTKFLINRDGSLIVRYPPQLNPAKLSIGINSLLVE